MLMDAHHSASHILFRLDTTYQRGTGERNLALSNLQNAQVIHDAIAGVAALRDWRRWYQRCIDFGMNLPDPMLLVGALTSMTKPIISKDTEVIRGGPKCLKAHYNCTLGAQKGWQSTPQPCHGWYCWGCLGRQWSKGGGKGTVQKLGFSLVRRRQIPQKLESDDTVVLE